MFARVPLRLRLTAAFALAMTALVVVAGVVAHAQLAGGLDDSIDNSLTVQARNVGALLDLDAQDVAHPSPGHLTDSGVVFAQVLSADGRVVDSAAPLPKEPVLDRDEIREALKEPTFVDRDELDDLDGRVRLLARVVRVADGRVPVVVVAGASLRERDEALARLNSLMVIGGPLGVVLMSLAGYWLAGAALRPVEAMRRRASGISGEVTGERLPLPAARDEISRLGETLNAMLARIDASLARERRLVADASHELRTPLAILTTELELADRPGRSPEQLREAVVSARAEVARLVRLADDLLVIARSDQGRLPLRREAVDVPALLDRVALRFAARARAAGRAVTVRVDRAQPPALSADPQRLEQALGNLVDNALTHGALTHGAGPVVLEAYPQGASVVVAVSDGGPGFPPEFVERAFERFTRADAGRTGPGAGLGLAIVRLVAVPHGGEARIDPPGEGGARVSLVLPGGPPPGRGE